MVTSLQAWDNPFKGAVVGIPPVISLKIERDLIFSRPIEQGLLDLFRKAPKRAVDINPIVLTEGIQHLLKIDRVPLGPRGNGALSQRKVGVRHNQIRIKISLGAQTAAINTSTLGIIEGKHLGSQFGNADAAPGACRLLAEEDLLRPKDLQNSLALGEGQGKFH